MYDCRKYISLLWIGVGILGVCGSSVDFIYYIQGFGINSNRLLLFLIVFGYSAVVLFSSISFFLGKKGASNALLLVSIFLFVYIFLYILFGDEGSILYRIIIPLFAIILSGLTIVVIFTEKTKYGQ